MISKDSSHELHPSNVKGTIIQLDYKLMYNLCNLHNMKCSLKHPSLILNPLLVLKRPTGLVVI